MTTHDLQEEPESTIGSKPMHPEERAPARESREEEAHGPPAGAPSRMRREEGEETEDGSEIRDRDREYGLPPERLPVE